MGLPSPPPSPLPPTPVDPSMQGGGYKRAPRRQGERTNEDFARNPKAEGPAAAGGFGAPQVGSVPPPLATATPRQYVDPLMIERLRAKGRPGYGGTFLTGPQGVRGLGSTLLGGGR